MNILLFGAPGTGKGTQSDLLVQQLNFCHISTGNLLRSALYKSSPLGLKAQSYMDRGQLVPDELVIQLIEEVFTALPNKKNVIFDGFPRTLSQAKALDHLLNRHKQCLNRVIHLHVASSTLIKRLTGRRIAKKSGRVYHIQFCPPKNQGVCDVSGEKLIQRTDDTEKAVKQRLKIYDIQTTPLIEYYQNKNILSQINGEGTFTEIFNRIKSCLP